MYRRMRDPGVHSAARVSCGRAVKYATKCSNDLAYGGAAKKLADDWKDGRSHVAVPPRAMSFLATAAAIGLLTMKGLVESVGDPLKYSDEELIEGLARIFEAAVSMSST